MHLPRLAALPVLALALCSASSFAQTTRLPVVQHQVQAGDTLEQLARRYLGELHSGPSDWDPVSSRRDLFARFSDEAQHVDHDDPWQFTNFLVSE